MLRCPPALTVAIRRPAVLYGYDYSTDCFEEIVRDLTKEERFVEPAHLQIVCDRLWDDYGRRLQASADPNDGEPLAVVEVANLRSLNGVGGILRSFLAEFVDDLEATHQRALASGAGWDELAPGRAKLRDPAGNLVELFAEGVERA